MAITGTWSYAAPVAGITNSTTAVTIKAAAGTEICNYIEAIQLTSDPVTTATEFAIRDGAAGAVLWRVKIPPLGLAGGLCFMFPRPLKGSANTLLEIVTLTATTVGAVHFNAQGFTAP